MCSCSLSTMHYITLICLFLSALTVQLNDAAPNGAPELACQSMVPGHPFPPETDPSPFTFTPSARTVNGGQNLTIHIRTRNIPFRGFIIQARNANNPSQVIGQFAPSSNAHVQLMRCAGRLGSSVTHTSAAPKNTIALTWQAPTNFTNGRVHFR